MKNIVELPNIYLHCSTDRSKLCQLSAVGIPVKKLFQSSTMTILYENHLSFYIWNRRGHKYGAKGKFGDKGQTYVLCTSM